MKFIINKVILWFNSGEKREIKFKPNKINIITGDNNTGKTTILEIIDYCLLSEKVDIPLKIINENVKWYGLNFSIFNKKYTIARGKLTSSGKASNNFFFDKKGKNGILPINNKKSLTLYKIRL